MFLSIIACRTRKPKKQDIDDQILCARLLEAAVVALPNLRYVAFAQIPDDVLRSATREYGQRQWPNARWQWWRIIRGAEGIEVREVPTWEGERVRKYMRDADMAHADDFDDQFEALR
ncbi:uncharacterized protein TRAVEDRAFT_44021 [Trametes versicolor FP-101664 SS1]|uniref:uncharacterized protein n=1 Tax=Trametes versicolor (strain FP-101664) TaxID=717944 RepID=UPI0004624798|nr:uncharacterized protein TRAVEDRAFT_44021 [Trametes versicolor FP-101664 SS1]EIW61200.1 hypothetical protein TRAVEDRAFT_44021 [Trametes versicolor FP-101664 SS1]